MSSPFGQHDDCRRAGFAGRLRRRPLQPLLPEPRSVTVPFDKSIPLYRANTMIAAQLWGGVVFLIALGLGLTYHFQLYVRGRYVAERHTEGAMKALMVLIRWCWAIIWAVCAILSFVGSFWLAKYTLSQVG